MSKKFKLVLLGDSNVGKTCFLIRYVNNTFTMNHMSTLGVDVKSKEIESSIGKVTLQIWDTAGQEKYRSLGASYLRGSDGVLILYDITDRQSFEHISNWLENIDTKNKSQKKIMIVGNKSDCESQRKVLFEEGQKLCKNNGFLFTEASAKEGIGVDNTFKILLEELITLNKTKDNNTISLDEEEYKKQNKKKKKCICKK